MAAKPFADGLVATGASLGIDQPLHGLRPGATPDGTNFSAFLSPDGVTWTAVLANKSLTTIPTAATVGLFECSHKAGVLGTATFDNVSFTPGP